MAGKLKLPYAVRQFLWRIAAKVGLAEQWQPCNTCKRDIRGVCPFDKGKPRVMTEAERRQIDNTKATGGAALPCNCTSSPYRWKSKAIEAAS